MFPSNFSNVKISTENIYIIKLDNFEKFDGNLLLLHIIKKEQSPGNNTQENCSMEIECNNVVEEEETDSRSLGSTDTWSSTEEDDFNTYKSFCLDEDEDEEDEEEEEISDYSMKS